jgi:hypothetical protein
MLRKVEYQTERRDIPGNKCSLVRFARPPQLTEMNTASTDFKEVPDTGSLKMEQISLYNKMSLDFSIDLINPSSRTIALQSTQPLTEILLGVEGGRSRRKADNLTVICESIVYKMWEPRRLRTLWTSTACYRVGFTLLNIHDDSISVSHHMENVFRVSTYHSSLKVK